ncbi:hypothetical protein FVEG_17160 [Fusarium verticillioides 7600]|uniref:Uncharacterized protein n=1 Tax=Gibberella moniliformis (strain M3125 / FGSC 7600) TaxID=334819 RepID=W7N0P2_GIBM7|nr:hypothetical protein FVEG_17160 [Fusarium verticillioides 7600]EWG53714.1 hypothetical protein FVEG_17160 [Fusarium verticillioides 7600]
MQTKSVSSSRPSLLGWLMHFIPAPELQTEPILNKSLRKTEGKQKRRKERDAKAKSDNEEDGILADYIASLKENTEVSKCLKGKRIEHGPVLRLSASGPARTAKASSRRSRRTSTTRPCCARGVCYPSRPRRGRWWSALSRWTRNPHRRGLKTTTYFPSDLSTCRYSRRC